MHDMNRIYEVSDADGVALATRRTVAEISDVKVFCSATALSRSPSDGAEDNNLASALAAAARSKGGHD